MLVRHFLYTTCSFWLFFCTYRYILLDMHKNTPKHFVIQLGALIALYVSITALTVLVFSIINLKFPDESYYWEGESAREAIRTCMAVLIVFFPTFIALTRISNQNRRKESNGEYTGLTRWLVYVSLMVAGGVLLGDLVTLINYFLNGEITTRFIYKVFALFFIVGSAFHYYLLDVRGYWNKRVDRSIQFGIGAVVLVVAALTFGFQYIETPNEVREQRLDQQQVNDLQSVQSYVENYFLTNDQLPGFLTDAYDGLPIPTAPEGRPEYTYTITGDTSYELCATFAAPSATLDEPYSMPIDANYNWNHQAGEWCFDRTITMPTDMKPTMPI